MRRINGSNTARRSVFLRDVSFFLSLHGLRKCGGRSTTRINSCRARRRRIDFIFYSSCVVPSLDVSTSCELAYAPRRAQNDEYRDIFWAGPSFSGTKLFTHTNYVVQKKLRTGGGTGGVFDARDGCVTASRSTFRGTVITAIARH